MSGKKRFQKVAVLMGGPSSEREVSLRSGAAVAQALRARGYDVAEVVVGLDNSFAVPPGTEVAFVAMHGRFGEDGTIQALLRQQGLRHTGSSPEASRRAFDKSLSKPVLVAAGIPTPPFEFLRRGAARTLPLPVVVKPVRQGSSVGVARVFREADLGQFGPGSGLDGRRSDWLAAVNFDLADGIALTARTVFDDDFDLTKGEARVAYSGEKTALASSLIWAVADTTENRPDPTQEVTFDARRKLNPNWSAMLSGRYDFVADRGTVAGMGLEFLNECVRFDVSLSRRFTSSSSVSPTTDFALSLDLVGFGSGVTAGPARTCRK